MRHHRLGAGGAGLGLLPRRALGGQRRLQRGDLVGQVLGRGRHGPIVARAEARPLSTIG